MIQLPFQCPSCISWPTEQISERHFCEVSIFFLNREHNKNLLTMAIKTSQDCDSLTQGRNLEQRLISYVGLLCQWRQFKNSCNVFKRTASQITHHHQLDDQVPFCAVHLSARCLAADLFVYRGGEVRPSFPTPACLCFSCLASAPLWPPPRLEATQPPPTCQASNCTLPLHMHQVYARPFFNTCTENTCIDQG